MNLERGLKAMNACLKDGNREVYVRFSGLESRLLQNIDKEKRHGDDESLRSDRARIVEELNRLALSHCNITFNDLCLDTLQPQPGNAPAQQPSTLPSSPEPTELKPLHGQPSEPEPKSEQTPQPGPDQLPASRRVGGIKKRMQDWWRRLPGWIPNILAFLFGCILFALAFPFLRRPLGCWYQTLSAELQTGVAIAMVGSGIGAIARAWSAGTLTNSLWKWASLLVLGVLAPSFVFLLSISSQSPEGTYSRPQCATPTPTWTLTPTPTATSAFTTIPTPTRTPSTIPTPIPTHTPTITPSPTRTPCPDIQESCLELDLATGTGQQRCPDKNGLITLKSEEIQNLQNLTGQAINATGQALTSGADGCRCEWKRKAGPSATLEPTGSLTNCGFSIGLPAGVRSILLRLTVDQRSKDYLIRIQP